MIILSNIAIKLKNTANFINKKLKYKRFYYRAVQYASKIYFNFEKNNLEKSIKIISDIIRL